MFRKRRVVWFGCGGRYGMVGGVVIVRSSCWGFFRRVMGSYGRVLNGEGMVFVVGVRNIFLGLRVE